MHIYIHIYTYIYIYKLCIYKVRMWALDQQSTKERMEKGIEILTGTIFFCFKTLFF
jgi:hypothetical protein